MNKLTRLLITSLIAASTLTCTACTSSVTAPIETQPPVQDEAVSVESSSLKGIITEYTFYDTYRFDPISCKRASLELTKDSLLIAETETDDNGNYHFDNIAEGDYELNIRKGKSLFSFPIQLTAGENKEFSPSVTVNYDHRANKTFCHGGNWENTDFDLNGDGVNETIKYYHDLNSTDSEITKQLIVNGVDYTHLIESPYYEQDYSIIDIDTEDNLLHLALDLYELSDHAVTEIYEFDGESLYEIGRIGGNVAIHQLHYLINSDTFICGDGSIICFADDYSIQRWYMYDRFTLTDGKLVNDDREYYYPVDYGTDWTTLVPFTFFTAPDTESETVTVDVGVPFKLIYTDRIDWVCCELEDGTNMWMRIDNTNGYYAVFNGEESVRLEDSFDGVTHTP